jgi:inosine-uridine nucleoside N-ribohydrolase
MPEAAKLYRDVLAAQPDGSVVFVSVGQLSNAAALIRTKEDRELVKRKVKAWVCMGGVFPQGKEANIKNHAAAAREALANWPTRVILSGWEIGVEVLTGGRLNELPEASPVRQAYALYNGVKPHKSWDQTAVLYAARCIHSPSDMWQLSGPGEMTVDAEGNNQWRDDPRGRHVYLKPGWPHEKVARAIEELMLQQPV